MLINYNQIKILHALLNQHGMMTMKAELIYSFSNQRTHSSKELMMSEATQLINYLKNLSPDAAASEVMRRKIISMAHKLQWQTDDGRIDIVRLNNWCVQSSYLKKPLNDYAYTELTKLVSQFKLVYTSYIRNINS